MPNHRSGHTEEVVILTNYGFEDLGERAPSSAFLLKGEIPTKLLKVINLLMKGKGGDAERRK